MSTELGTGPDAALSGFQSSGFCGRVLEIANGGIELSFPLEFAPVVFRHKSATNKVCADGKYVRLSRMQSHHAHLLIDRSPIKEGRGENRTD